MHFAFIPNWHSAQHQPPLKCTVETIQRLEKYFLWFMTRFASLPATELAFKCFPSAFLIFELTNALGILNRLIMIFHAPDSRELFSSSFHSSSPGKCKNTWILQTELNLDSLLLSQFTHERILNIFFFFWRIFQLQFSALNKEIFASTFLQQSSQS